MPAHFHLCSYILSLSDTHTHACMHAYTHHITHTHTHTLKTVMWWTISFITTKSPRHTLKHTQSQSHTHTHTHITTIPPYHSTSVYMQVYNLSAYHRHSISLCKFINRSTNIVTVSYQNQNQAFPWQPGAVPWPSFYWCYWPSSS